MIKQVFLKKQLVLNPPSEAKIKLYNIRNIFIITMIVLKFVRLGTFIISIMIVNLSFFTSINAYPTMDNKIEDNLLDVQIILLMRLISIPSLIVCIINNDSIAYIKSYGYTNYYQKIKTSIDDNFLVGSISKTVTATALMQLCEKGFFDLDDDINKYLPFEIKNSKYPDRNITFRMLLSHQSSLNDFGLKLKNIPYILYKIKCNNIFDNIIKEMFTPGQALYNEKYFLDYPPGEQAQYCELGYSIAGYLVEKISGKSFEEYCQENIFKPLNMKNTSFDANKLDQDNLVKPYTSISNRLIPLMKYDFSFLDPPAGLWTNAEDLSHFYIAHLNYGVYNKTRILKEETVKIMHTKQYPNSTDNLLKEFMAGELKLQHGLGWFFVDLYDFQLEGHAGAAPGYNCHMYAVNKEGHEKTNLILLSNGPILFPAAFSGKYTINGYMMLLDFVLQKADKL